MSWKCLVATLLAGLTMASGGVAAVTIYQTGFEAPAFTDQPPVGPLLGTQGGWSMIDGSPERMQPVISSANPASGSQHLRFVLQPDLGSGELKGAISAQVIPPAPAGAAVSLSIDVNISDVEGAQYDVIAQSVEESLITAWVTFSYGDEDNDGIPGDILIFDGTQFMFTGYEFTPGQYKTLRIDVDPTPESQTITYYYGGEQIYAAAIFGGTTIDRVVITSDNFQMSTESGDFDNVTLVAAFVADPCMGTLRGDINCDGRVDNFDIDPFVLALINFESDTAPAGFPGGQPCWEQRACWGDLNHDAAFNNFDIDPFIACIVVLPAVGEPCP